MIRTKVQRPTPTKSSRRRVKGVAGKLDVDFDDRLFAHEDGVVINRATMRKFGFRVGELTVFFRKLEQGDSA